MKKWKNLAEKIDNYTDELYADLGLVEMTDEQKAHVFARVEEHLYQAISSGLSYVESKDKKELQVALEQQNYSAAMEVVARYPASAHLVEKAVDRELKKIKFLIIEEQNNARETATS